MNIKILIFCILFLNTSFSYANNNEEIKINTKDNILTIIKENSIVEDIFEINFNKNWNISALINFKENNIYIPLKFFSSDLLKIININEENTIIYNEDKNLILPYDLIDNINLDNMSLNISLTEKWLNSANIKIKNENDFQSNPINAFYFNYSLAADNSSKNKLRGNFDTVYASKKNWLIKNKTQYDGETIYRLETVFQKDFKDLSGLRIGDVSDYTMNNFNSVGVFGIKYSSPYFNSSLSLADILPTLSLSGFAITPSKMDLFINSQLILQKEISVGNYNLEIPNQIQGFGEFRANIYDINGVLNVVTIPFYSIGEIIKKGSYEYSFTAGKLKKITDKKISYENPYFSSIYKIGLLDNLSQDIFLQYTKDYHSLSTLSYFIPNHYLGVFKLGYATNSYKQNLAKLSWEKNNKQFSFGFDLQKSNNKNGFCFGFEQKCLIEQNSVYFGTILPKNLGSINLNHTNRKTNNEINNFSTIYYTKQINSNSNLFVSFSNMKNVFDGKKTNNKTIYLGYSYNLSKNKNINTSINKDNSGTNFQQNIYFAENTEKPKKGYGSITYSKNKEDNLSLYYGAKLDNFSYQINAYNNNNGTNFSFNLDGALSYLPNENYFKFSKNMSGGLIFVEIENLTEPVDIYHENKYSGKTDNKGRYVITNATPMNSETVNINVNTMPKNITLEKYKKSFYIPFSGAVKVDFKSKPLPYIIKIKNTPLGAVFEINNEFYVIGNKGLTSIDSKGKAKIPLANGDICYLDITPEIKEYDCNK